MALDWIHCDRWLDSLKAKASKKIMDGIATRLWRLCRQDTNDMNKTKPKTIIGHIYVNVMWLFIDWIANYCARNDEPKSAKFIESTSDCREKRNDITWNSNCIEGNYLMQIHRKTNENVWADKFHCNHLQSQLETVCVSHPITLQSEARVVSSRSVVKTVGVEFSFEILIWNAPQRSWMDAQIYIELIINACAS